MDTCFSLELLELVASHCTSPKDLARLSLVSRFFHAGTVRALYRTLAIRGPRQYSALTSALETLQSKRYLHHVRCLDLSSYTARGSGWTEAQAKAIVDPDTLARLLSGCVYLKELYVGEEMMQAFVVPTVIRAIFYNHPRLQVLDFTGFCDRKFTDALADVFNHDTDEKKKSETGAMLASPRWSSQVAAMPPQLNKISFYMCMALSQSTFLIPFFERLAANGNKLTRLELSNTKITSDLFKHLDPTELTHINLQGCHGLKCCSAIMPFLMRCQRLVELNLNMSFNGVAGSNFCRRCLVQLMQISPSLRVLNLGGHVNMDDDVLTACIANRTTQRMEYLSLSATRGQLSVNALAEAIKKLPALLYLNVARTLDTTSTMYSLQRFNDHPSLQVLEITPGQRYPHQCQDWMLSTFGRRAYFSRGQKLDPRFAYSNKLLMNDSIPESPMTQYWSYSC